MRNRVTGASLVLLAVLIAAGGAGARERPFRLFNGKDLTGWVPVLPNPDQRPAETWSVRDGALICTGSPHGYLRTNEEYGDYVLTLDWRYVHPEQQIQRNSGVLLHCQPPDKVWPQCIEVQLMHGQAGDLIPLNGGKIGGASRTMDAEKPIGEWNQYEITSQGGKITVALNGKPVNQGADATPRHGWIGLQSEGGEIQFRNVRLRPLPLAPTR